MLNSARAADSIRFYVLQARHGSTF